MESGVEKTIAIIEIYIDFKILLLIFLVLLIKRITDELTIIT